MTPVRAVGIVNGTIEWKDPREYLEACLYIVTHSSCRGVVTHGVLLTANKVSNYAVDHGEEKTAQLIQQIRNETNRSLQ